MKGTMFWTCFKNMVENFWILNIMNWNLKTSFKYMQTNKKLHDSSDSWYLLSLSLSLLSPPSSSDPGLLRPPAATARTPPTNKRVVRSSESRRRHPLIRQRHRRPWLDWQTSSFQPDLRLRHCLSLSLSLSGCLDVDADEASRTGTTHRRGARRGSRRGPWGRATSGILSYWRRIATPARLGIWR